MLEIKTSDGNNGDERGLIGESWGLLVGLWIEVDNGR